MEPAVGERSSHGVGKGKVELVPESAVHFSGGSTINPDPS
jgi:hypothetical protein